MHGKKLIKPFETVLRYSLFAILILATLAFSFVLIINWEDWFFGIKLDGLPAGTYLFIKALTALTLTILLIRLPKYRSATALITIAFFGFLFFDSAATIQKNSAGRESFSIMLALSLIIPVLYLIVHLLSTRINPLYEAEVTGNVPGDTGPFVREGKNRPLSPVILVGCGIIVLVIGVFILMPIALSILAPYVPFIADLGAPPAQDTIITRINPDGNMAWQTTFPGYSLDLVRTKTLPECGYLVYGTYWISGKPGPVTRALNIECKGTIAWDYSQILGRGTSMPGTIQSVDPVHDGYIIKLDTGKVIRLDNLANVRNEVPSDISEISTAASVDSSVGYYPSTLSAPSVFVKIRSEKDQGTLFTIEDTLKHKDIQSIYSVNPTPDGGYLVFASVKA